MLAKRVMTQENAVSPSPTMIRRGAGLGIVENARDLVVRPKRQIVLVYAGHEEHLAVHRKFHSGSPDDDRYRRIGGACRRR